VTISAGLYFRNT